MIEWKGVGVGLGLDTIHELVFLIWGFTLYWIGLEYCLSLCFLLILWILGLSIHTNYRKILSFRVMLTRREREKQRCREIHQRQGKRGYKREASEAKYSG